MAEELLEVSHALAFGSAWRLGGSNPGPARGGRPQAHDDRPSVRAIGSLHVRIQHQSLERRFA